MKRQRSAAIAIAVFMFILCLSLFQLFIPSASAQAAIPEDEIDRYIQAKMKQNNIPGLAVAITRHDEIIYSKGYGSTSEQRPITADTPFAVASLSKSFTALAVMQLVEAGKVNLDKPVAAYIPSYQPSDPRGSTITVRQLLNHTSGITDTVYPDMTIKPQPYSLDEVVQRLNAVTLHSDPGKQFRYNNTNYQLLAGLVEAVSHETFPEYLQRHIFGPLEMNRTLDVANTNQFQSMFGNYLSQGHYLLFGKPVAAEEPEWFVEGAAGMVSTVNDMAKWLQLQLNHGNYKNAQLLSGEGIDAMHAPSDPSNGYGMGWEISKTEDGKKRIQHGGILWTYKAEEILLPDEGLGVVVLFNSGLNAFVDYYSFASGLSGVLTSRPPEDSFLTSSNLELGMGIILLITVLMGLRSLARLKEWEERYKRRSRWRMLLSYIFTLFPCYVLISVPQIITFIGGGRVLSLEGIFMMMPSIVIWLAVASLQSIVIVVLRVFRTVRLQKIVKATK
ncbi:serine hydrolase domain-containing protein [Paenibacillus allorhizosphaerae]|nr:serine hydrolase domain-containing protein [Paenibacillus allorhizosphaerae]